METLTENVNVTIAKYIDLANVTPMYTATVDSGFKTSKCDSKTVGKLDSVFLAGHNAWAEVIETSNGGVKVNLNSGLGKRPDIVREKYDQIILWKGLKQNYVNEDRILKQ